MNSYIKYEAGDTIFVLYNNDTKQIIMIHPILYVIDKMSMVLSGKMATKVCRLKTKTIINSENCTEYSACDITEPGNEFDDIISRNTIAEEEPTVLTEKRLSCGLNIINDVVSSSNNNDLDGRLDFIKYVIYNIEQAWYYSIGDFATGNNQYVQSYDQVLDLYYNDDKIKSFMAYDMQEHWVTMETARITSSRIYQACLTESSIDSLRSRLRIIAKSGDIAWEV